MTGESITKYGRGDRGETGTSGPFVPRPSPGSLRAIIASSPLYRPTYYDYRIGRIIAVNILEEDLLPQRAHQHRVFAQKSASNP